MRPIVSRILLGIFSLVIAMSNIATTSAIGFAPPESISNRQKAHLNITFTGGTDEVPCSEIDDSIPSGGGQNKRIAFNYFVKQGFSEKHAAAIVGNFVVESGVNPKRVQGSGIIESETLPASGGYGIAQWDDRKPKLKTFADNDKADRPIYDLNLQLDFVIHELKTDEKPAYDDFIATKTIRDATITWEKKYERPQPGSTEERIGAANEVFGDYGTGGGSGGTADPLAGSSDEPSTNADGCATAGSGEGGTIVEIAQRELKKGVVEDPIGCDAGNPSAPGDCGKEVNKYTDSTLEYWCADFVSWVYREAGTPFKGGLSGGWRIPSVEGVQAFMEKNGKFYANKKGSPAPRPGDVYVIDNGVHVGIVVKVEGNKLYTISGNTSTENFSNGVGVGDRVYQDYRSDSSITGWGGL